MRTVPESTRDALRIFALALFARVSFVVWAHARFPAVEDGHFYDLLARRLAAGAGYTWAWPDGAVTYVAHYPVGYPALLAAGYVVFGGAGAVAMGINAVLGAWSAWAACRLVSGAGVARWRSLAAGAAVALHPALVPYTAAVMTEGVTASLWIIAAAIAYGGSARDGASRAADRPGRIPMLALPMRALVACGVVMGVATLVRPQSLVLAPVFGALAASPGTRAIERLKRAALVAAVAVVCVLPWTARNCARMNRCALVSVNEGWNLLIGAQTTTGGWEPVNVPRECATVWDEAAKDVCFDRAARREIEAAPGAWVARIPAKWAQTFDYFGAAPWYLHASDPGAFDERAKVGLAAVETVVCRLFLLGALVACGRLPGERETARKIAALGGAVAALTLHGWIGYAMLVLAALLLGRRALARVPVAAWAAAVVGATAALHGVFFGAGRYGLVVVPFVTALAFVDFAFTALPATSPSQARGVGGESREAGRAG